MTEYSDKEKELIEYYESLPKFSLNIFEMERLLKKPLEYTNSNHIAADYKWFKGMVFIREAHFTGGRINMGYESDLIEIIKDYGCQYLCNFSRKENKSRGFLGSLFEHRGMPVREAKDKLLKRLWLKYFH